MELKLNHIYQGDCLVVMKDWPDKCVNLVLTDPPYNSKSIGPNKRKYSMGQMQLPIAKYRKFCEDWFIEAKRISETIVFTPGISNVTFYPPPTWIICWHKPAAVSFNRMGGYNTWEPIMVYGGPAKGKRLKRDFILCNTLNFKKGPECAHPCPKPLILIKKLIDIFSNYGDWVLDPFMGSGTTAVACKELARHFTGIELNPEYIKMANNRLKQEVLCI